MIDAAVKTLLAAKSDYKAKNGKDWVAAPAAASAPPATTIATAAVAAAVTTTAAAAVAAVAVAAPVTVAVTAPETTVTTAITTSAEYKIVADLAEEVRSLKAAKGIASTLPLTTPRTEIYYYPCQNITPPPWLYSPISGIL